MALLVCRNMDDTVLELRWAEIQMGHSTCVRIVGEVCFYLLTYIQRPMHTKSCSEISMTLKLQDQLDLVLETFIIFGRRVVSLLLIQLYANCVETDSNV